MRNCGSIVVPKCYKMLSFFSYTSETSKMNTHPAYDSQYNISLMMSLSGHSCMLQLLMLTYNLTIIFLFTAFLYALTEGINGRLSNRITGLCDTHMHVL
jgi:hypothetical protein